MFPAEVGPKVEERMPLAPLVDWRVDTKLAACAFAAEIDPESVPAETTVIEVSAFTLPTVASSNVAYASGLMFA